VTDSRDAANGVGIADTGSIAGAPTDSRPVVGATTDDRDVGTHRGPSATLVHDPRLLVPLLLLVDSLHYVFARLLLPHLPPVTSALYMLGIATIEVAILTRRQLSLAPLLSHWRFFTTIGVVVAVNTNLGFLAVKFVDPGTAALLSRTSVIFGVGLGIVWLGERLDRVELAGAVLALAGAIAVSFQPGEYLRFGSLIVVIATFLYALHSAVVKRYGGQIAFAQFFFYRLAVTTGFLILLAAGQGALVWPAPAAWPVLVLAGTVNVVISRGLYYLALRRLDMSLLTIILTLSPVVTVLWSMALFGSRPSPLELIGGIAILGGVMVVSANRGGYLRAPTAPRVPRPSQQG
jgi:drug/metabolite transporter (DMT)-like permease